MNLRYKRVVRLSVSLAFTVAIGAACEVMKAADQAGLTAATTQPGLSAETKPMNGPPTIDDVQGALDRRDYANTVKLASRMLALHGKAAEEISRYRLFSLKAEGQLGLKAVPMAIEAFQLALKETSDPDEISLTKCNILLLRRAGGTKYVPKTTPPGGTKPGPIDLLDRDNRKAAFGALLDDEIATLSPKIKSASTSQSLTQIFPVLQQVEDLNALDVIANGSDDKTSQMAGDLLTHARNLISSALKGMWQRVDDIDKFASQTTAIQKTINSSDGGALSQSITKKNGLSSDNKSELNNIIATCDKIAAAAEAFMKSSKNDKDWSAITSDTQRVSSRAGMSSTRIIAASLQPRKPRPAIRATPAMVDTAAPAQPPEQAARQAPQAAVALEQAAQAAAVGAAANRGSLPRQAEPTDYFQGTICPARCCAPIAVRRFCWAPSPPVKQWTVPPAANSSYQQQSAPLPGPAHTSTPHRRRLECNPRDAADPGSPPS